MPKTSDFFERESQNGEYSPKIKKELNKKITYVCWALGINKSKWVERVLNDAADACIEKIRKAMRDE